MNGSEKRLYGLRTLKSAHRVACAEQQGRTWSLEGPSPYDALARRGLTLHPVHRDGAPPFVLLQGERASRPTVAVVGARAADGYGLAVARQVARDAVALGCEVVSCGAEGCDAAAHEGALDARGPTTVVFASGHDHPYPRAHERLFARVVSGGGALVSAYWPSERPRRYRFLERNGLIAALADVVVVVRARLKSGSLTTARAAERLGKPVLAVPGNVGEGASAGTNVLLARGARAMTGPVDLARALDLSRHLQPWPVRHLGEPSPWQRVTSPTFTLEVERQDHQDVLCALAAEGTLDLDGLHMRTGVSPARLLSALMELELAGRVVRSPDDHYHLAP